MDTLPFDVTCVLVEQLAGELRRTNEMLAARDAKVDSLTHEVSKLKLELKRGHVRLQLSAGSL